jgi:hypothetical protein
LVRALFASQTARFWLGIKDHESNTHCFHSPSFALLLAVATQHLQCRSDFIFS